MMCEEEIKKKLEKIDKHHSLRSSIDVALLIFKSDQAKFTPPTSYNLDGSSFASIWESRQKRIRQWNIGINESAQFLRLEPVTEMGMYSIENDEFVGLLVFTQSKEFRGCICYKKIIDNAQP